MERSEKVFKEFIDLCREVTSNDTVVLELLQKRYNHTNLHFLWSNEFPDLIDRCSQKIKADRDNKYVYIKEFTTELKAYKGKPLKHLRDAKGEVKGEGGSQVRRADDCPELEPPAKKPKLKTDFRNISEKPKEKLKVTPRLVKTAACRVTTPSCTLIPLSLMCNSQFGSDRDVDSLRLAEEMLMADEPTEVASKTRGGLNIKVSQVNYLHLPEPRVVLEKCNVELNSSLSARKHLLESSSDAEADETAMTKRRGQLVQQEEKEEEEEKDEEKVARDSRLQRHIKKLELLLKKISDEIKRLQETELSLEDLDREDSNYTLEDRYKRRFVKVWNRLCQLKGRDTTTGREVERKLNYCGTNYPEVNKSISRLVNKARIFPDYSDIHAIIIRCNRKHNLRLRKSAVDRLAREAFTEVGNILQKRRMADHLENFGCHLTENLKSRDDPALFDSRLRQQLEDNLKLSKTKLDEVISKFAQRQDENPGEEEDDDDGEEEEEEVEEDEKKFLEDLDQVEGVVLTNESSAEEEKEEQETEELSKENVTEESEESAVSLEMNNRAEADGDPPIDVCTEQMSYESMSLDSDSVDRRLESPQTGRSQTTNARLNMLECLTPVHDPTILSSENENVKALDVEQVEDDGSMDISIIDLPLPAETNLQVAPPSKLTTSVLSSAVISCGKAATVSQSPPLGSTSDSVEPVRTLIPVAAPTDVICIDDETNSPVKNKDHPLNGTKERQAVANGTVKQTNLAEKQSSLALGLVKLKPPSENVLQKFAKVGTSHRKALAVRQPMVDVSTPTEAVMQSSDEEDVVEILSIPAPNGRTKFENSAFGREIRSSQKFNTTQTSSQLGQKKFAGDECCIMTTVEEHVVSTVVRATSNEERSHGIKSQQVEMTQHTTKTMRVVGQIIPFSSGPQERRHQQQQQMNRMMQGCSRMSQVNQPHTVNHVIQRGRASEPSRTSQTKRVNRAASSVPLQKQLDDISSQIVSSIFKNQPKKSSSGDPDIIICDDASAAMETTAAMTTTDRALKDNQLTVSQVNRISTDPCKDGRYEMQARQTVARTSQGSRSLLAGNSSSQDKNRAKLPPIQPPHPSRTLPELSEVIELN